MKHLGTVTLETPRLVLRRSVLADAPAMCRNWCSDPEVTKFLTWATYQSETDAVETLRGWLAEYEDPAFYQWAIVLKELGEPVGSISVVHRDDNVESVEIGYCVGRRWWRQGITSEALGEVIRFFFEDVGVNRVESRHDPNNPNSGKVMAKCGMAFEGVRRQADRSNQGLCDTACYAILREDFNTKERSI